jgi:O-antigen/teichoic acid export membrane protein
MLPGYMFRILRKLAAKLRRGNSIYLGFALGARVLSALGMFLAIRRFAPGAFGEMAYLQATAVSAVAFSSFGIELSLNAQLSRKQSEGADLGPTIVAGGIVTFGGILLACGIIALLFSSQLNISGADHFATVAICTFGALMISASLLNSIAFALHRNAYVGFAYVLNAAVFTSFAVFADKGASGINLLLFQSVGQFVGSSFVFTSLARLTPKSALKMRILDLCTVGTAREIGTLLKYGIKQILVVSLVTFSQWLIQRRIVFGEGGPSDNAIYSVGNQIFNIITFLPTVLGPITVTKFASAGEDAAVRQKICINSLRMFGAIAVSACVLTFVGLYFGVRLLPPRYADCVGTGLIASMAAAFQVIKAPFSLYFLSELKVSREIASAVLGSLFMIVATTLLLKISPNGGTVIRLIGCAIQAVFLGGFFLLDYSCVFRLK